MEGDTLPELTRSHTHFRTFTDTLTRTEALEEEQMGLRLIVKPPPGLGVLQGDVETEAVRGPGCPELSASFLLILT